VLSNVAARFQLENFLSMKQLEMTAPSVCAVVVTYNPSTAMVAHLADVTAQASSVVVVDNSSCCNALQRVRESARLLNFHLIENGENLGVAEALNQGARWAKSQGYSTVILFDQDTRIAEDFIHRMLKSWIEHQQKDLIAVIQPRYLNPLNGRELPSAKTDKNEPISYMTSGSLLPVSIFDRIGWFASEYFIDYVDVEYCLRARARGYRVVQSKDAILFHAPGQLTAVRLFGAFGFETTNHSAVRRYYLIRNRIATERKYFRTFPLWTVKDLIHTHKDVLKVLLGESDKRQKITAMLKGLMDGLAGRMGKMPAS
jgi:rhamnosyltransferase